MKPSEIAAQADWDDGVWGADGSPHYIYTPTDEEYRAVCVAYLRLREAAQNVTKVTSGGVVKRLRDVLEESDDDDS